MEWLKHPSEYPEYLRARIRAGQGIGTGRQYRRWGTLRSSSRKGTTGLRVGILTGRIHELPSEAHRAYFLLRERVLGMRDIREHFPVLNISDTLKICADFGIEHVYSGHFPEPFCIDFLFTREVDGRVTYEARDLLPRGQSKTASRKRDELRVKHAWCKSKGIDWKGVDTSGLTRTVLDSLMFLRGWYRHRFEPDNSSIDAFVRVFLRLYRKHLTLAELLDATSVKLGQRIEQVQNQFRYAGWTNRIPVDVKHVIRLDAPVVMHEPS